MPRRIPAARCRSGPKLCLGPASAAPEGIRGRIGATLYLGNLSQYQVELGAGRVLEVQQMNAGRLGVGDEVVIEIDPERCYFIPAAAGLSAS